MYCVCQVMRLCEELRTAQEKVFLLMSANSQKSIEIKQKDIQLSNITRKCEAMISMKVEKTNAEAMLAQTQDQMRALSAAKGESDFKVKDLEKRVKVLEEECKSHALLQETKVQEQAQLEAAQIREENFRRDYESVIEVVQQDKKSLIEKELLLTGSIRALEEKLRCSQALEATLREELHYTQIERDSNCDLVKILQTNYFAFLQEGQCFKGYNESANSWGVKLPMGTDRRKDQGQERGRRFADIEKLEAELQELLNKHIPGLDTWKEVGSSVSKSTA